jgi:uncharacterized protein
MKLLVCIGTVLIMTFATTQGSEESRGTQHRIVFEFTSEGATQNEAVLNNVENTLEALGPGTEIFVIAHGPGIGLVLQTNENSSRRVSEQGKKKKVVFAACKNTLRRKNIAEDKLLPGVTVVDSGVAEVVRRQEAGWSYVKSGH